MAKRIFLFVSVNILVVLTISITLNLLGIQPYLESNGIDYTALLIFCACFGFGGALISLLLSRFFAKLFMGVRLIDPNRPASEMETRLLRTVNGLAQRAGLPAMPQVGIFESPMINAFATGPSKSRALVAVSSGLLHRMDDASIEGVLGHEISHVANGDMVTMTLIQGVVNTFVMFFARVIAWGITQALAGERSDNRGTAQLSGFVTWGLVMVLELLFGILGAIVVNYYSRHREFRADRGGATLAGREKMIHALKTLKQTLGDGLDPKARGTFASLQINGKSGGLASLFATHPNLDDRIAALQRA